MGELRNTLEELVKGAVTKRTALLLAIDKIIELRNENISLVKQLEAAQKVGNSELIYAVWCQKLVAALKKLSFAAQTSGGWKSDVQLIDAISNAEQAMGIVECSKAMDVVDKLEGDIIQLNERVQNCDDEIRALKDKLAQCEADARRYQLIKTKLATHEIRRYKKRYSFAPRFTSYEYDTFPTIDEAIDAIAAEGAGEKNVL